MEKNKLKVVLGLNETEFKILKFLQKNKENWYSKKELAKVFGKDRSTIHKSLNQLEKKYLIIKKKVNTYPCGYCYKHKVTENQKKVFEDWIEKYFEELKKEINLE